MPSLLVCSMVWFLPAFIFPMLVCSSTLLLCPFFNKEIDTVPSYLSLQPISDGDHLDKCDSPGKQTTKPLLCPWLIWIELRNHFVWICSSRKNGWPVCLRWLSLCALLLFIIRRGKAVRPDSTCACKELNSHQDFCIYLPWVLGISATTGNLQR